MVTHFGLNKKLLDEFHTRYDDSPFDSISEASYDESTFAYLSNLRFNQVGKKLHSK